MALVIYILLSLISIPVSIGLFIADSQGKLHNQKRYYREDVGISILIGTILGLIPIIRVFVTLCMTGFGQHGLYFKYRSYDA
jgi:hypothetical protein